MKQLTQDHQWGTGKARYLSRALGIDLSLDIDYKSFPIHPGDTFVFTTDGVHDYLLWVVLLEVLLGCPDLEQAAQAIVERPSRPEAPIT